MYQGQCNPYKPCNHNVYIEIIIFLEQIKSDHKSYPIVPDDNFHLVTSSH